MARSTPSSSATQQTCLTAASEDDYASKLPEQRRVTAQIMRHWEQHKAIEDRPTSPRCAKMRALHRDQVFNAITRTEEGHMSHVTLPADEDYHCEPRRNAAKGTGVGVR